MVNKTKLYSLILRVRFDSLYLFEHSIVDEHLIDHVDDPVLLAKDVLGYSDLLCQSMNDLRSYIDDLTIQERIIQDGEV